MSGRRVAIDVLDAAMLAAQRDAFSALLIDAVAGGASVHFLAALAKIDADRFWEKVAGEVGRGEAILLAAAADGRIVGTVQLRLTLPPSRPHAAEVAKLLVCSAVRRQGIGRALMIRLEDEARARGRTLLTLDTEAGSAGDRLYAELGWMRLGEIPAYAQRPAGTLAAAAFYCKRVGRRIAA